MEYFGMVVVILPVASNTSLPSRPSLNNLFQYLSANVAPANKKGIFPDYETCYNEKRCRIYR